MFGVVLIGIVILLGPIRFLNVVSSALLSKQISGGDLSELRVMALNYTKYDGFDSFMFASELAQNLPRVRYSLPSKDRMFNDLKQTMESGGDCKASSMLFVALMHSVGYNAYVDCSIRDRHCVARIPHQSFQYKKSQYMIVDLTVDAIWIYENSVDHWKNPGDSLFFLLIEREANEVQE